MHWGTLQFAVWRLIESNKYLSRQCNKAEPSRSCRNKSPLASVEDGLPGAPEADYLIGCSLAIVSAPVVDSARVLPMGVVGEIVGMSSLHIPPGPESQLKLPSP